MLPCLNCLADPLFFQRHGIAPPTERGFCPYCGSSDVPIVRLRGISGGAGKSQLNWKIWCEAAKRGTAGIREYADMFYDLAVDLKYLSTPLTKGATLFRARRGFRTSPNGTKRPYQNGEIGVPPDGQRRAGRANKEGEPVLYCAEQEQTAVAEVRPARGQLISVCRVRLREDCSILDLAATPSGGPLPPAQAWQWLEILGFLRAFEAELAKPLERDDDPSDYVSCQIFAQSVTSHRLSGIRFRSSLNPGGANTVLLEPSAAEILESRLVQVTRLQIEYESRPGGLFVPGLVD